MGVHRLISAYLAMVAVAVAVQFVLYPLYAYDSAGEIIDTARARWDVLNWFMALGLVLMLFTTFQEKRRLDSAASVDIRRWLVATVMFYGTVLLTLGFVPNLVRGGLGYQRQRHDLASNRHNAVSAERLALIGEVRHQ